MFSTLFYGLRSAGVSVSIHEWLTFLEAIHRGLLRPSLDEIYAVGRALLVKNEAHFDTWDQVFLSVFRGLQAPASIHDELRNWLDNPILPRELTAEEMDRLQKLAADLETLRQQFEQRLQEQTERHDGGSHWIGTGGTSAFGAGGTHPAGIRVGPRGGGQSAMQVASERRFRDYRHDAALDVRGLKVALKKLRRLKRTGSEDELDIDETVEETGRNAGELELVFRKPRKNDSKLLLLMDAGGSMDPHARRVSQLFAAAHGLNHFKDFRHYTFHNCVYDRLYTDIGQLDSEPTAEVLRSANRDYDLIMVGDAYMHPAELTHVGGAIDYWHRNSRTGLDWLQRLAKSFGRHVWLNPLPPHYWRAPSIRLVREVFPMFPLTVTGLEDAIDHLLRPAHKPKSLPHPDPQAPSWP